MYSASVARRCCATLALALLAGLQLAAAHGGSLHPWDFNTPGYQYPKQIIARCGNFAPYNASISNAYIPGALPFFPSSSSALNLTVYGFVELVTYLDGPSCTPTTALIPYLSITYANDPDPTPYPYANQKVYGYTMTGTCGAGVGDLYRNNATLGDARGNLLWWRAGATDADGMIWGAAPNVLVPRWPDEPPSSARSLLLVPPPAHSPPLCCDFSAYAPKIDSWLATAYPACLNATAGSTGTLAPSGHSRRHLSATRLKN